MRAIILAAGSGKRMGNATIDKPKCMLKFRGKTLLEWQIQTLKDAGIEDIAVVTGYKSSLFKKFGLVEFHNPEWDSSNMVVSLESSKSWLANETCIISYSDIFYTSNAVESLLNSKEENCIVYYSRWKSLWLKRFQNPLDDLESFKISSDDYITEIGLAPKSLEEIDGQYMGLLKISPMMFRKIQEIRMKLQPPLKQNIHLTHILNLLIVNDGFKIKALKYDLDFFEFDVLSDFDKSK